MNDAFLSLWLTLRHATVEPDPVLDTLATTQLMHPGVDLDTVYSGESLLKLAAHRAPPRTWFFSPVPPEHLFDVQPHHRVALDMIDRGANPWRPDAQSNPAGMEVLLSAVDAQAWPVMRAILNHPDRPPWSDLLEYQGGQVGKSLPAYFKRFPLVIRELVNQGMSPDVRIHGTPLLFIVPTLDDAEWLVSQGAQGSVRDDQGRNLLAYRQASQQMAPANEGDRLRWVALMGRDQVDPAEVFVGIARGAMSKVRPLFEKPSQIRQWRWELPGGRPVSLADACAWGQIAGGASMPKSVQDTALAIADPVAQDLLWLAALRSDDRSSTSADPKRLLAAVQEWVALDRRLVPFHLPMLSGSGEAFSTWVAVAPDPGTRHALLDLWVAWHESDASRWNRASSFTFRYGRGSWEASGQSWAPAHRLAMLARRWLVSLKAVEQGVDYGRPAEVREKEYAAAKTHALEGLVQLFALKKDAGATFPEVCWGQLRSLGVSSPRLGDEVERRWLAQEREAVATDQAVPRPSGRRLRA